MLENYAQQQMITHLQGKGRRLCRHQNVNKSGGKRKTKKQETSYFSGLMCSGFIATTSEYFQQQEGESALCRDGGTR